MAVLIREIEARRILSPQKGGFLHPDGAVWPNLMTHSLSLYTGCSYGKSACGSYCYAQSLASWQHRQTSTEEEALASWGDLVIVKTNAAKLLQHELKSMTPETRQRMRVFMSSTSDPYQPIENHLELPSGKPGRLARQCLMVFQGFNDLGLVVIHTRSPLVMRDFDLISQTPQNFVVAVSIETDDPEMLKQHGDIGTPIRKRFEIIRRAADAGIPTQISVSPCFPHTSQFAERLATSGANRIVVDSFVDGDGSRGVRTGNSVFGRNAQFDWRDDQLAKILYEQLKHKGVDVYWSNEGFISPAHPSPGQKIWF